MGKFTIVLDNKEIVLKRIDQHGNDIKKEMQKAVAGSARRVKRNMKANAPRHTGNLQRSIGMRDVSKALRGENDRLSKTVTPRARRGGWHKGLVTNGTNRRSVRQRLTGAGGRLGTDRGSMPANSFIADAEASDVGKFNSEVRRIITRQREV